jgi:SAM-dependent methyltransferase
MNCSAYDLKAFYNSKIGRIVRRILRERILEFWPDLKGLEVMGHGYALPYLRMYEETAQRIGCLLPDKLGAHHWPPHGKNLTLLGDCANLPFENNSLDRILMIHSLEFSDCTQADLQEIWRVLRGNGRLLIMVPNRSGLWARADWSPFGQGTPFSVSQLTHHLRSNLFIHERTEEALFMPPYKSTLLLKSAGAFEYTGKTFLPFAAGVHMIEASKQLYARSDSGGGSKVPVGRRRLVTGRPVLAPEGF